MMHRQLVFALAVLAAGAQPASAETDFQQWAGVSARIALDEAWSLQHETQARFSDNRNGLFQIQSSLLVAYKLAPDVTVAAGYLHSPAYVAGDFDFMERRAREQITFDNVVALGAGSLGARLRAEQRWRDDQPGVAWRIRPYLKYSIPLGDKAAPTVSIAEELFINLNTSGLQSADGIERLRSAITLSVPVSKSIKLEGGYLHQHRFVRGGEDRGEHALTAMLALAL